MDTMDDFWDTQKILEEFDSDVITPVLVRSKFVEPQLTPEDMARSKVEPLATTNKTGCYICTKRTSTKLTNSGHPICIECVVEHLVNE